MYACGSGGNAGVVVANVEWGVNAGPGDADFVVENTCGKA
jgi:hypothetical protein